MAITFSYLQTRRIRSAPLFSLLLVSILTHAIFPSTVVAAMYKQVDKDGNVSYTDTPDKANTTPIVPAPLSTFSAPPTANTNVRSFRGGSDDGDDDSSNSQNEASSYLSLLINSPETGSSVRANGGSISVQVTPKPALDTKNKHRVVLVLDGQTKAQGQSTSFTLSGLDRGQHTLSARIESAEGDTLISSTNVSFQVLRTSIQRRAN